MNDPFISLPEIREELKNIELLKDNLARHFILLSQQIQYIFVKIKSCETFKSAQIYFIILNEIQSLLTQFIFVEQIGIPERLERFTREFDRHIQDQESYFNKIKNGECNF